MRKGDEQQIAALQKAIDRSQEAIADGQRALSKMQTVLAKLKGENNIIEMPRDAQNNTSDRKQA